MVSHLSPLYEVGSFLSVAAIPEYHLNSYKNRKEIICICMYIVMETREVFISHLLSCREVWFLKDMHKYINESSAYTSLGAAYLNKTFSRSLKTGGGTSATNTTLSLSVSKNT